MTEDELAKMTSLKTGYLNTILRIQQRIHWYWKQPNVKIPNWRHEFNYDAFYENFMDDKSDPDTLLGDLNVLMSAVNPTSTFYQANETFRVKLPK